MAFHEQATAAFQGLPTWVQTLLVALLVLLAGWAALAVLGRYMDRVLSRARRIDATLRSFFVRTALVVGWVFLLVIVLSVIGVDTAALVGGLAIGGFVIGFALKDTLGNLAAGVMLLFYRPFNLADVVTVDGQTGEVVGLGMALTVVKLADGRIATLPNGAVLGGTIINHTREPIRRADVAVGIGYGDDIDTAVRVILEAVRKDERVLADPPPDVRITGLGDHAVDLQVRPWVRTPDTWKAQAELHGTVKRALDAAGINIPYPQRDVHLKETGTVREVAGE